jgi:hypothetical protein
MPDPVKIAVRERFGHRGSITIVNRAITVRKADDLSKVHRLHRNSDFIYCKAFELFKKMNALRAISKGA